MVRSQAFSCCARARTRGFWSGTASGALGVSCRDHWPFTEVNCHAVQDVPDRFAAPKVTSAKPATLTVPAKLSCPAC